MLDLKNKRVLFFCPAFFGYEIKIKEKMEQLGAVVDFYDVRSITSSRDKALLKVFPFIFQNKSKKYYENILKENKNKDYDFIFIVKCDMTPISILKDMKEKFTKAKMCLYLYDSVKNVPGVERKFRYFDSAYSFDLGDCEKYKELRFRPLFYADQFKKQFVEKEKFKYDVCFIGTIHSDRYKIIKQVENIVKNNGLKSFYFKYLQSDFMYSFYKMLKSEFKDTSKSDFDFEKMTSEEIAEVVNDSKIILDIQHPKQTGLTMRTVEMIGMNKKIITTNEAIKKYDFYDSNNVSIIDRNNVQIDMDFLKTQYRPLKNDIYERYSLESWIKEILG